MSRSGLEAAPVSLMMANSPGLLYGRFDSHLIIHDDEDDEDDENDDDDD